jgi:hypothetical protein
MIPGGYYLKARKTKESAISKAPPHVREIWDYFMSEAFYKDGKHLKRGQLLKSYQDIIDDLAWYVGWRKCSYKKDHCETAMKWLKKATMITAKKTTRGLIITICNYDEYQTPENYENHNEINTNTTRKPQSRHTIEKEGYKKDKNERINIFLQRYSDKELIQDVISALKTTRKTGKISDTIIVAEFEYWEKYPASQVEAAMRTYLDRDCAGDGKKEEYLRGIIRNHKNTPKKRSGDKHNGFDKKQYTGTDIDQIPWAASGD